MHIHNTGERSWRPFISLSRKGISWSWQKVTTSVLDTFQENLATHKCIHFSGDVMT
ncbi:hypothetical protein CHS0354_014911, partial [Potamilus streckersoni]